MKRFFSHHSETLGRILICVSRALLGALLAGAQFFGGYAPFAVGAVGAAGPGWEGLGALVGTGLGALALLDFPHALRTMACSVLLFTANNAFYELKAYQKSWFLPALTAGLVLVVEAIYAVRSGSAAEAAYCLLATALAALFAHCCREIFTATEAAYRTRSAASLVLLTGILSALSSAEFSNGFAPGRIASALAVLFLAFDRDRATALAGALCIGLAMDLATMGGFLHTACYGLGALAASLTRRGSRVRAAGAFAFAMLAFALPLGVEAGVAPLYEGLAGTLVFLLLPARALRAAHAPEPESAAGEGTLRRRVRESALALRELYESVSRAEAPEEENPAIIYDRAAEAVCRDCPQRALCWEAEYARTYHALSDATAALLESARARAEDFSPYFADRCVRFSSFLAAVDAEARAFLLRREYRARFGEAYRRSAGQYARLSELLSRAADGSAAETGARPALAYRVGMTLRPKDGESVSGDSASAFETGTGELCLLLSDGMGSGEEARRESAFAVRLAERFLRAGIDASGTLRTLNDALTLRAELGDSFVTVDLLTLSLQNGEGELYKYGAAPSYVKRGRRVRRVTCSCLPAGLAGDETPPEATHVRLEGGSFFVMVTDGVADALDDEWLQALLADWEGENPQMLVSSILADSCEHKGTADDAGVLALYLPGDAAPREV